MVWGVIMSPNIPPTEKLAVLINVMPPSQPMAGAQAQTSRPHTLRAPDFLPALLCTGPCAATLPKVASMLRFRALLRSPHVKAPLLRAAVARMSTTPPTTPHPYESFLSGTSANYVDDMYESWQQDPAPQRRAKSGLFTARVSVKIEVGARGDGLGLGRRLAHFARRHRRRHQRRHECPCSQLRTSSCLSPPASPPALCPQRVHLDTAGLGALLVAIGVQEHGRRPRTGQDLHATAHDRGGPVTGGGGGAGG